MGRRTGRGATRAIGVLAALAILPLVGVLAPAPQAEAAPEATTEAGPRKAGWWSRRFGGG